MNGLLTPEWFIFAASGHVTEKEVIQEGRKNIPRQILMGKEKGNSDFLGNQGGGGGSRERQEGEREQSSFASSDV